MAECFYKVIMVASEDYTGVWCNRGVQLWSDYGSPAQDKAMVLVHRTLCILQKDQTWWFRELSFSRLEHVESTTSYT